MRFYPPPHFTSQTSNSRLLIYTLRFDVIDSLPTPFGLIRSGVAPDHQDVKNASSDFSQIFSDSRIRYFGGVTVGEDVGLEDLEECYDAVVLSYGCEGGTVMSLGDDSDSDSDSSTPDCVYHARKLVDWYNGRPNSSPPEFRLTEEGDLNVTIVGGGNVSLDCARIILKAAVEDQSLTASDVTNEAYNRLKEVSV